MVEPVGGEPLISRVVARLREVTDRTVVVVNDRERASLLRLPDFASIAIDRHPGKGSLGGIMTGLSAIEDEWALVVASDMPFLNVELLRHILSARKGRRCGRPKGGRALRANPRSLLHEVPSPHREEGVGRRPEDRPLLRRR